MSYEWSAPDIEQSVIERMGEMYTQYAGTLRELNNLKFGNNVVVPVSEEHARFMLAVAQSYLSRRHQETIDVLMKDY